MRLTAINILGKYFLWGLLTKKLFSSGYVGGLPRVGAPHLSKYLVWFSQTLESGLG